MKNIFENIKKANLVGRGGASYPTYKKWENVNLAKGSPKYVICNCSEGEPGVFKDFYILDKYPEKVFEGLKIAMDYLKTKYGYININTNYYKKLKKKIDNLIKEYHKNGYIIKVYKEHPSYIGGEETAILNSIEGKKVEARLKPPHPAYYGLFGKPTLVHNVETLFNISEVNNGKFNNERFYSISGKIKNPGVFFLDDSLTIYEILKQTGNIPKFKFFVQTGGNASGEVFNEIQIKKNKVGGAGSICIYENKINPKNILLYWLKFYKEESCGKCTPCREGTYALYNLVKKSINIPWNEIFVLLENMNKTSICYLGKGLLIPIKNYYENIYKKGKK